MEDHIESWEGGDGCNVRAWSGGSHPQRISEWSVVLLRVVGLALYLTPTGDLRIKVNPSCAQEIASLALQLRLDEYAEVKFP